MDKKFQLGKLKLKKQISNKEGPKAYAHSRRRSRILKRSTKQGSSEDDSDLIMQSRRNVTLNQKARTQGISTKQIIDKSTLSKIMKNRSRMNIKCNSEELRKLMLESITDNSSVSKRTINNRAEAKFGGSIDVICSKDHFSYVYSSNLYCEAMKGNVTCIAFRQSH
ncbi:unnamed protein product [Litomosoides sigmodontis]|uniref:Ground-like domain-containing protein n=1 Tax=Litomosoides sigmodontis TaxID=42156 RepID=A0A3P6V9I0_LITSI|nr:unnamed protein product [Litomosoides sigmodontis]